MVSSRGIWGHSIFCFLETCAGDHSVGDCSAGLVCNMEYLICIDEDATTPADGNTVGAGGQ